MTHVLVVDDHPLMRKGISDLLTTSGITVTTAASGTEALQRAADGETWDVVLMDVHMPAPDGIETTRALLATTETRVVMLTSDAGQDVILKAVEAGAAGYLVKDAEPDELVRGVQAAAAAQTPFDPRAVGALLGHVRSTPAPAVAAPAAAPAAGLTPREREIVELVADGLMNKQIARRLHISERTVKAHLTNAFARIGVTDRTQAAVWVERNLRP